MIEIRDLYKSFADKKVLQGVNLIIEPGQTTTIIGGSGSGKSVLFKHVIGLMKPDSGSILVEGEDITKMRESDLYRMVDKFGMVFQSGALFDSLSVGENVAFGIKNRKDMDAAAIDLIIERSLNQVGLSDIARLLPAELSGGMKKRVAIARVIAKEPAIIMFDEPTTGLDPIMADMINELIIKVSADPG
ncbi:MAG: ATP-binding cassette domain-containing protein, partial [Chrysiogenales bacterium]